MGYMQNEDLQQLSSRIERRTDRILMASGAMFLIWQIAYFIVFDRRGLPLRNVDIVGSIGFIAWAGALLMLLATGGGAFRRKAVREILDDELARSQRARAYQNAFWAVILVALSGYIAAHFTAITARSLAHMSLSAGVLVSVMTLAYLRRR
jgi:hypothetical protein